MSTILLVADSDRVIDSVHAALSHPDTNVIDERDPEVAAEVAYEEGVDAVVVDIRIGSMGGMALVHAVRNAGTADHRIPVTVLLDREADVFLARRSGAANWVVKTAASSDLRRTVESGLPA
ncbi:MAG: response regulator [Actinomycetia bacterium]|nr:response regulator [Actinomycetes bacterium]